jgi:hypothetical protein
MFLDESICTGGTGVTPVPPVQLMWDMLMQYAISMQFSMIYFSSVDIHNCLNIVCAVAVALLSLYAV